jgi:hypothetical protein
MLTALLATLMVCAPYQNTDQVSLAEKQAFIELVKTLPTKGEFYTDDAVRKAGPYIRVLFALTEKDLQGYDVYNFLALNRTLCDDATHRAFADRNFTRIQHPKIKVFWAAMLFDEGSTSAEIKQFLLEMLKSEEQTKELSEIMGPRFERMRQKLLKVPQ